MIMSEDKVIYLILRRIHLGELIQRLIGSTKYINLIMGKTVPF